MTHIEYFKVQAKKLFKDYKTKTPRFDAVVNDFIYEYKPQHFDIDEIVLAYQLDEKSDFSLMKAQHIISQMVGFNKWTDLLKASEAELELAKLLFDNQDKISLEDWEMYISGVQHDTNVTFGPASKLEIFQQQFLNGNCENISLDYRLNQEKFKQFHKDNEFDFKYDIEDDDINELLKIFPEYTIKRKVNSIEDAFKDICKRVSQYILDKNSKKMILTPYIANNFISIYVRKNYQNSTLEIARIEIFDESNTGKKYGTNLINYIHLIKSEFMTTLIECVSNRYLQEWCRKNGWQMLDKNMSTSSYFKRKRFVN